MSRKSSSVVISLARSRPVVSILLLLAASFPAAVPVTAVEASPQFNPPITDTSSPST